MVESVDILEHLDRELLLHIDRVFALDSLASLRLRVVAEQSVFKLIAILVCKVVLGGVRGDLAAARSAFIASITVSHSASKCFLL